MSHPHVSSPFEPLETRRLMAGPSYAITDLFPFDAVGGAGLESGDHRSPDINNGGVVVGPGLQPDGLRDHATARFVKRGNVSLVDFGNFGLHVVSDARGVNDANQVVGSYDDDNATRHAFLAYFAKKGRVALVPLDDVPGQRGAVAQAINNLGQIVGSAGMLTAIEQAVLWQIGKKGRIATTPLPHLNTTTPVPGINISSIANDINDNGVVAGMSTDDTLQQRATLWFAGKKGRYAPVGLEGLGGALGGINASYAHAINDANLVVGKALKDDIKFHPAAWAPGRKGRFSVIDLGAPRGSDGTGTATAVNSHGVIVGKTTVDGDDHATIWFPGRKGRYTPVDLNTYLPRNSPWTLSEATSINDDGTIVGAGLKPGTATWMLTPTATGAATVTFSTPAATATSPAPQPNTPATPAPPPQGLFSKRPIESDLFA